MTFADSGKVWTSADNHYTPMKLADLKAFGARYVAPLADNHCVLFTWATCLLVLGDIADVIRTWASSRRRLPSIGSKPWPPEPVSLRATATRSNSEVRLLATRGTPLRIAADVHQVIMAPAGEHSAKPDEVHARIERLVNGPYLELFARRDRARLDVLGRRAARAHRAGRRVTARAAAALPAGARLPPPWSCLLASGARNFSSRFYEPEREDVP